MNTHSTPLPGGRLQRLRAWCVHIYTSLGLAAGLLALLAVIEGDIHRTLAFLGLALFIDATDGFMARRFEVKRWTPDFDGRKLDDISDYLTYTFIPVVAAYRFGVVAGVLGQAVLALVLILSAYGFCQEVAKTDDGYFTGFPNFWNIVIFYLYLANLPSLVNAIILLFFAILVLLPIKYVSHLTRPFYRMTLLVLASFAVTLVIMAVLAPHVPAWLAGISLLGPVYYVGISLYLHFARRVPHDSVVQVQTRTG